jgi:hypothetical protein
VLDAAHSSSIIHAVTINEEAWNNPAPLTVFINASATVPVIAY